MSFILPINCGYWQFKSLSNQCFKTRLSEIVTDNIQTSDDVLEFEGKYYIVGHGKKNIDLNKTENEFLKICILNMCSRFTTEEYQDFKLLLTSPALTFSEQQILLPQSLIGGYEIHHNGKPKIITISECSVFPETFLTFLVNNPEKYENEILYILDIGGYTSSLVKISGGQFDVTTDYVTIPKGMYNIDTDIRNYLTSTVHVPCNLEDIYYYRKNEFKGMNINIKVINKIYNTLIEEIIEESVIKCWNVKHSPIIVTGGGGMDLFKHIKENYFNQAIPSNNPIFDNLYGLEIIAREMYGNAYTSC